jgi:hypothetical protein
MKDSLWRLRLEDEPEPSASEDPMTLSRIYRGMLRRFLRVSFPFWQALGFHIMLNHYSSPIPDTRELGDDLWSRCSELRGVRMNEERQLDLLATFSAQYKHEYEAIPKSKPSNPSQYYFDNGLFETVDGVIDYCMIRHFKPKRVFEIGSGNSTYLSAQAILMNKMEDGHDCELVAFEPYPNPTLRAGFPGLTKLVITKSEDIPLSTFDQLKENDILFIDSSHVLKIGGDVQHEILELLPRVGKGVIVHVHDIFIPKEILREWIFYYRWFYTEQYIFHAFLLFNDSFEVLWGSRFMDVKHREKLASAVNAYDSSGRGASSFWIRRIK